LGILHRALKTAALYGLFDGTAGVVFGIQFSFLGCERNSDHGIDGGFLVLGHGGGSSAGVVGVGCNNFTLATRLGNLIELLSICGALRNRSWPSPLQL
jgi:hypothetical protein